MDQSSLYSGAAAQPAQNWCTACNNLRFVHEFDFKRGQDGERKKTCRRHTKAAAKSSSITWEMLIDKLREFPLSVCFFLIMVAEQNWLWRQSRTRIEFVQEIDFDSLPVQMGDRIDRTAKNNSLTELIAALIEQIHAISPWRFWHERTRFKSDFYALYTYRCCQDEDHHSTNPNSQGIRDTRSMARYPCESQLLLSVSLTRRILTVYHSHTKHSAYEDTSLSPEVTAFVNERLMLPPAKIYQLLRSDESGSIPGKDIASRYQVYGLWQNANSAKWRRAPDAYDSACILLNELYSTMQKEQTQQRENGQGDRPMKFVPASFEYQNVRCVAIYLDSLIHEIGPNNIKELAMDATYGTNNKGMDLFAVMAEFEGTGVPIAYGFVEVLGRHQQRIQASQSARSSQPTQTQRTIHAMQGATTDVLSQFLQGIAQRNIHPLVFHTDKDNSEIVAIGEVWTCSVLPEYGLFN